MSRASIQSLSLLTTVAETIHVMRDMLGNDDRSMIEPVLEATKDAVYAWSCTGDEMRNAAAVLGHMGAWNIYVTNSGIKLTPEVLVHMALQCVSDLHTVINDNRKLKLLDAILEPLHKLRDHIDPEGDMFDEYEHANTLLQTLYNMVGFSL